MRKKRWVREVEVLYGSVDMHHVQSGEGKMPDKQSDLSCAPTLAETSLYRPINRRPESTTERAAAQ